MSNVLEFYIKLKDMMSSGLAKVAQVAKATGKQIVSVFQGVEDSIDKAKRKNDEFGKSLDNVASKGGRLMKSLGAGLSIAALIGFAKESLAQSAQAESQRMAFKVLTGSKFSGDALYGQIRNLADVTPYESQELMRGGKMLLGFGEKKGNVLPDLKMLGDVAAAQDDSAQALLGLSHAYGEVVASGKLLGRNTLEMINWGFNPLKEISIMTGKSMATLREEEERGAISAEMVRKAFEHATSAGGKYYHMMDEQSQTLSGRWSTFMDLVHSKMRAFGDALSPVAKQFLTFASSVLNYGAASEFQKFTAETDHLRALRVELGLTNISNQRRAEIFQELKANYPSIVENIKSEHDALRKLIPDLDKYLEKRYLSSGILKIKEQFSGDLDAVQDAQETMQRTTGEATGLAAVLAGKYGIATNGLSSGQLQSKVMAYLRKNAGSMINPVISTGANTASNLTETQNDYLTLSGLLKQNAAAAELYDTHIQGANKAREAIDRFNKTMGIKPDAPGKPGNPYADDSNTVSGIADGITKGGPRVININGGVKFSDKFELHTATLKEGAKEVEDIFRDVLMRVIASGASVQ